MTPATYIGKDLHPRTLAYFRKLGYRIEQSGRECYFYEAVKSDNQLTDAFERDVDSRLAVEMERGRV